MKEKISRDYNVNLLSYQNQSSKKEADLKAINEKETGKVNELNWTICELNKKIEELEIWKDINYNAYVLQDSLRQQVLQENRALSEKNNEFWAQISKNEEQLKKHTDEIDVLKLQVQIMTNGYAELYLKLNNAEAQLTVANIPISHKASVTFEIQ